MLYCLRVLRKKYTRARGVGVCVCVSSHPVIVIPDSLVIITVSSDVHKIFDRIRYVVVIIIIIIVVVVINCVTIILLASDSIYI